MEQGPPDAKERTPSSRVLENLLHQAPAEHFTLGWLMSVLHRRFVRHRHPVSWPTLDRPDGLDGARPYARGRGGPDDRASG